MAVFERETVVDADLDDVWDFHSRVDGLAALTPDWFHLEYHGRELPEDAQDPDSADELVEGSTVELSVRPLGVGPRQRWRSRIVARSREGDEALFRDEMVEGPFEHWVHTHRFEAVADGTRVHDHVEYRLADVPLGGGVDRLLVAGLAPTFRYRHGRLHALLGSGAWAGWD